MTSENPNYFSQTMAARLARRITEYWESKGKTVTVWTERVPGMKDVGEGYCIRSDLVNGLPRSQG